ncbi:hypothetical protein [Nannocystis sp. SCPEA4]|uniref:hypothetical protein n=1 Tax=Nannocystis sp. SCPEA4 TaxID=2996787 RepID=UPI0022708093|nr:hypothetical protein [Nannocystis sp. SCPEA4]MCY1062923.1 hypothetical protein [Nannocystis sp. SCPEA4]
MRHPRPLLSLSLLIPALAACPGDPGDTSDGSTTEASTDSDGTDTEAPTTGEPAAPQVPTNRYFLRIDDTPPPPVVLEMDKAKALEIFGETAAKDIKLIDVDSTALLDNVLAQIQGSCGDGWMVNNSDPQADCGLTDLGQTYGAEWERSPQYRMVALLTMTPANANVRGTSLSDFEQLFVKNANLFQVGFAEVLAGSLFCEGSVVEQAACANNPPAELLTRPFIPTELLGATLKRTLLASHPNIANDQGTLPITLYDALMDMQPLSEKLGPVGDHPGLLVPDDADFTTHSDALTPAFKMTATADSNLRRVDGIDASAGAGEMFLSLSAAPVAFDFNDPAKVKIEGIAAAPTVDMRMAIAELPVKIPACDDGLATCGDNKPDSPVGADYVWSQAPWSFEYIVATAAYSAYSERTFDHCYVNFDPCLAQVSIGGGTDPGGWSVFLTDFMSVKVPPPQFLWELLLDVAQLAVHDFECLDTKDYDNDGNKTEVIACAGPNDAQAANDPDLEIEEGDMRPVFALKGVPIGFTAEEMIAQIRPTLQSQSDKIADVILGNYWTTNARLDFYYRRAADGGTPYLFFVGPDDKRPHPDDATQLAAYDYAKPGFFADAGLTDKLSSTSIDGVADTDHEKYRLPEGESTIFMQDDAGDTYQLRFTVPPGADPVEIVVRVDKM